MTAANTVVTKLLASAIFGNDAIDVVTKGLGAEKIGNDADGVTSSETFPDLVTTPVFIRVRKRTLKGGHPMWRSGPKASMSFDLVRGVRVNGKPRHQFVLGLGSQQAKPRYWNENVTFWTKAIRRMTKHGIPAPQRQRLLADMVRKGARLPSSDECEADIKEDRYRAAHYGWKAHDNAELAELRSQFPALLASEAVP
jgi:hypothetical protein